MIEPEIVADLNRTFSAALDQDDPVKARAQLVEAGWFDLLDADPAMAAAIIFRIQGENCLDAAALDDVIGQRLSAQWPEASGEITVAYPLRVGGATQLHHAIFPAHRGGTRLLWLEDVVDQGLQIVELETELQLSPIEGVDPGAFLKVAGQPAGKAVRWTGPDAAAGWADALAWARVAVARQMVAGSRTLLTMAVEYAAGAGAVWLTHRDVPVGQTQACRNTGGDCCGRRGGRCRCLDWQRVLCRLCQVARRARCWGCGS